MLAERWWAYAQMDPDQENKKGWLMCNETFISTMLGQPPARSQDDSSYSTFT